MGGNSGVPYLGRRAPGLIFQTCPPFREKLERAYLLIDTADASIRGFSGRVGL